MENDKYRIGHGYDVHRLEEGKKFIIGGIEVVVVKDAPPPRPVVVWPPTNRSMTACNSDVERSSRSVSICSDTIWNRV